MTAYFDKTGTVIRKTSYSDTLDDFPTPPWATRVFFKYVSTIKFNSRHFLEPAAGRGDMVRVVRERGLRCTASDIISYGQPGFAVKDYCDLGVVFTPYDVLLTNPPFKFAEAFVTRGLREARVGVGVLCRSMWTESASRYRRVFEKTPPTRIALFSKRMPATHGKVIRRGASIMSHSWFWWDLTSPLGKTEFTWIPPEAQSELEKDEDYT